MSVHETAYIHLRTWLAWIFEGLTCAYHYDQLHWKCSTRVALQQLRKESSLVFGDCSSEYAFPVQISVSFFTFEKRKQTPSCKRGLQKGPSFHRLMAWSLNACSLTLGWDKRYILGVSNLEEEKSSWI